MMYFSAKKHRSPLHRLSRIVFGFLVSFGIIATLAQIPYDILREERFRIYGETHTMGLVTAVHTEQGMTRIFYVDYKYVDQDGFAYINQASLPYSLWQKYYPGSRIDVLFVSGKPSIARIANEIEPPFQIWLRSALND